MQSFPDRQFGVPLATQSDFRSIGEQMAWSNARVKSFSQYLLRDDPPSEGAHGKFESGLFLYESGAAKPAYYGFRLPLVVTKKPHGRVALWGLVRPAHGRAGSLEIQVKDRRGGWKKLADAALRRQRLLAARRGGEDGPPVARRLDRSGRPARSGPARRPSRGSETAADLGRR